MANIKITDLTAYGNPKSTDVLPIVDVGEDVTKKVSVADLLENAGSGTVAAPGIAFDGDSNTGIYHPGDDRIAISTNGTGRVIVATSGVVFNDAGEDYDFRIEGDTKANLLFVDASTDRVGFGTTSPAVECDVVGQVRASTGILFGSDTAAANALDDYEEGTWTPTFGDGGGAVTVSGGSVNAKYTKVGRLVHIDILISNVTISGSTTNGAFMTLPFVPASADSFVPNLNFSAVNDVRVGRSETAGAKLTLFTNLSNNTATWQNGSGKFLYISGTYRV